MNRKFSEGQLLELWSEWRTVDKERFFREVLERPRLRAKVRRFTLGELVVMAVERWFTAHYPFFGEAQRQHVVKGLYSAQEYQDHIADIEKDGTRVEGFYLSVFDDRWITWTSSEEFIDIMTYDRQTALPEPHVWNTILGITPLYFKMMRSLDDIEEDTGCLSQDSQDGTQR